MLVFQVDLSIQMDWVPKRHDQLLYVFMDFHIIQNKIPLHDQKVDMEKGISFEKYLKIYTINITYFAEKIFTKQVHFCIHLMTNWFKIYEAGLSTDFPEHYIKVFFADIRPKKETSLFPVAGLKIAMRNAVFFFFFFTIHEKAMRNAVFIL